MEGKAKCKRLPNWSKKEVEVLIQHLKENEDLALGKYCNTIPNSAALSLAWEHAAERVKRESGINRTGKNARDKWAYMKYQLKKKVRKHYQSAPDNQSYGDAATPPFPARTDIEKDILHFLVLAGEVLREDINFTSVAANRDSDQAIKEEPTEVNESADGNVDSNAPGPLGGGHLTAPGPSGGGNCPAPGPSGGGHRPAPRPLSVGHLTAPGPSGGGNCPSPGPSGSGHRPAPRPLSGGHLTAPGPSGGGHHSALGPIRGGNRPAPGPIRGGHRPGPRALGGGHRPASGPLGGSHHTAPMEIETAAANSVSRIKTERLATSTEGGNVAQRENYSPAPTNSQLSILSQESGGMADQGVASADLSQFMMQSTAWQATVMNHLDKQANTMSIWEQERANMMSTWEQERANMMSTWEQERANMMSTREQEQANMMSTLEQLQEKLMSTLEQHREEVTSTLEQRQKEMMEQQQAAINAFTEAYNLFRTGGQQL